MANGPYPHPIIAREGWPWILAVLSAAVVFGGFYGWWSLPLWLFLLFVVQFFRDPQRDIPQGEGLVLCPADGRVIVVGEAPDPYRGGAKSVKVSIFMNVFNVHSQRSPVDGTVKEVQYSKGLFVNAALDKASSDNERNALIITLDNGVEISCVQVAGLIARRILCYVKAGDRLARGQRYGFIRFGSRVDVFLPPGSVPKVAIGDVVKASSTVLAELPRP
ncbi:Phosphatidylserine decarboxylase proenzyme [Usitatibacter rugosus]|uniref:Phosphatidylserine decarboxylase proenzyme n=1 Tax=Usitatibacter rugosus TaxID=2732067 RepID=A0A6M4GUX5_9PROT|nr:phosphatidylserine decarboxylase [Usitatibacter rugosus]QJR10274.1 Phosphatidylserine decarboxylase proenzyme [Usitatibacter rugosus]